MDKYIPFILTISISLIIALAAVLEKTNPRYEVKQTNPLTGEELKIDHLWSMSGYAEQGDGTYTGAWIMRVTEDGKVEFNREDYPHWTPDKFADQVIENIQRQTIYFNCHLCRCK